MHAYLLVSQEIQNLKSKIQKIATQNEAKVLPVKLQKIEDVRDLRKLVKLKLPQKTAILIRDIDHATIETQNSFLKNLEEPQKNLIYILTANNLNNVIDTIISRCDIVNTKKVLRVLQVGKNIDKFQNSNIDGKFEILNKIKDRKEAIKFVNDLIYTEHKNRNFNNMENYLNTFKNLLANGNVSLQLNNMLVSSLSPRYN